MSIYKKATGSKLPLKEKIDSNTWDCIDDFLKVLRLMRKGKWAWIMNPECKYVNLRIDMRDGGCLIMDRNDKRIDPKDLAYQYGTEEVDIEEEKDSAVWSKGRAFVYAEAGDVEYFDHFLSTEEIAGCGIEGDVLVKSECGGIRPLDQCRPLDYVKRR